MPPYDPDFVAAYVPESSQLNLEEAMLVATQRDEEAAEALKDSVLEEQEARKNQIDAIIRELFG